ncbi:MAG: doxx family protein [Cyclobacteriaceae bacterium]
MLGFIKKYRVGRHTFVRISIGVVYLWFGLLKFFPDLGPAEELAKDTISLLTGGVLSNATAYGMLAFWETLIGAFLIFGICPRYTIAAALIHMAGTFMPFIVVSEATFNQVPLSLTLTGQYIIKNLVIVSALISLYPDKRTETALNGGSFTYQKVGKIRINEEYLR